MSLALVYTRANIGVDAPLVSIEVHLSAGLPAFNLVGLPETTVKESRDRVRSAMINCDFEFPSRRITVNMAPADLPKGGGRFDLAIAIGIIAASKQLKHVDLSAYEFVGELALSGQLRGIQGALPMSFAASASGRTLIVPKENGQEACLVSKTNVISASSLLDVYAHLNQQRVLQATKPIAQPADTAIQDDMCDIIEQAHAKRALEIAACGAHNALFFGPAGTGKSMLASRLLGILPDLSENEALSSASIRSIVGEHIDASNWRQRPFRQPHHSSSAAALVGGGSYPKPGEISLAHNGILFLDELPEFGRHILDVLREPLETGKINLSRAAHKVVYPCEFQLICAMNPSPTGDVDDKRATPDQVLRYLNRISGPFLDRIDLQVNVPRIALDKVMQNMDRQRGDANNANAETSEQIKQRVTHAQRLQMDRQGCLNKYLSNQTLEQHCQLQEADKAFLTQAITQLNLSMRAFHRTLRVARSIADLAQQPHIDKSHLAEALSYRSFDRLLNSLKAP